MATQIKTASVRWPSSELASPFQGIARQLFPRTVEESLAWAEELWLHHGLYSQAIRNAVRYFMTEIEILSDDLSYEIRKKYQDILTKDIDLLDDVATIGDDYIGYGNAFTSVHIPFIRNIVCPKCGGRGPLKMMWDFVKFTNNFEFAGQCPFIGCDYEGIFDHKDMRLPEEQMSLKITRWPPQVIAIEQHPISRKTIYYLNIEKYTDLQKNVGIGNHLYMEETPWEIVEAIHKKERLQFSDNSLFHIKNEASATLLPGLGGWGLPTFLAEFETVILVFLLDKYNETILTDYLIPFRVITPAPQSSPILRQGAGDIMLNLGLGDFVAKVKQMIERHRKNPTDWNFAPFPLSYQVLGGEAKNLAPVELLEHEEMRLLHSMGIPTEFYAGSIQSNTGPIIGFKMFEKTWQHFTTELNKWLTWYVGKQAEIRKWEKVGAHLVPVAFYEDPDTKMAISQLYAAGKVSESTYFRYLGLNSAYEQKRVLEEQDELGRLVQERQLAAGKDSINLQALQSMPAGQTILDQQMMQQQQAAGGAPMPAGGAPAGGAAPMMPAAGGAPAPTMPGGGTLDELLGQADQIAQQLLGMDPTSRRRQLIQLKNGNQALHAQVKARLADMEQQYAQQGIAAGRQGQMGPPAPAA